MSNVDIAGKKNGLEAFRITGLPPDFYYIPNFISVEEEASILQKVSYKCLRLRLVLVAGGLVLRLCSFFI